MSNRPAGRGHAFERLISLESKARLASGLLWWVWVPPSLLPCMGPMPNHASTHCGTWRVLPGGMSQMFRLLLLGNGWADCIEIWYAVGDPLVTAYAVITGEVSLHVRTCTYLQHRASVSHKRLDRLCSNLVCGLGSLPKCLPQVIGEVHLHVRTCAPLSQKCSACRHSVAVGPIALKFGITWRPISYSLCSNHGWGISARAHVHTALLYLRNGSVDWVQFWCVSWES